ncbi:MAG: Major Facilitator Superfamily protein [Firmicutes bacterium ADurb.Bin248]|nr:MAG: Major Facilitator Superfamily protein [Firmicutes bacterium ADurb.Bin248]HOF99714.1 MFS transporter [Clostridia bacterium]HPK15404.1 MFS transporter [Clostridia bacterium]
MKARHKLIFLAQSFSLGLLLPVQSLMLRARGCTLPALGLAVAAYAIAVIAAEVPSGIFADLCGRKTAYLVSCGLSVASSAVLLFAASFAAAAAGLALAGLSVAFASGSAEALILEEEAEQSGAEGMKRAISSLRVCEGAGLTAGAVAGGFLPGGNGYAAHLLARMALAMALGVFACFALRERPDARREGPGFRQHVARMGEMLGKRELAFLLAGVAAIALPQFLLETYWQPRLGALPGGGIQALFGLLCAAGFGATAAGSFFAGRIKALAKRGVPAYFASGAAFALLLALLATQGKAAGFAAAYLAVYLAIGAMSVLEQVNANALVENNVRASMLSLVSFTARAGGVAAGFAGAALLGAFDVSSIWRLGALFTLGALSIIALSRRLRMKKQGASASLPDQT